MKRSFVALALVLAGCVVLAGCGSSSSSSEKSSGKVALLGAGSTFVQPFFSKAFSEYAKSHNVTVNYQGLGSGAGIQQFTARTVDFGASDVPMNAKEVAAAQKAGGPVVEIPVALGGVSAAYNLPGVKSGLHLSGPVLAEIYLGTIKTWNDPAIASLNPGVKLPSLHIAVAHRSDSSGTSYIFTNYLSSVSSAWKSKVGTDKTPAWPTGAGGKGNAGVAGIVQQTPGAIGYVELAYVLQSKMTQAAVENSAHAFLLPTQSSILAAAEQFPHVSAVNFSIVNAPGSGSYPIVGYSWALLYRHPKNSSKGKSLARLMTWTVTAGQVYAKQLDYVTLPKVAQTFAQQELTTVK